MGDCMDRLAQVNQILSRYQEQVAGLENALIVAEPAGKVRLRQQIEDLQAEVRPYAEEKSQLIDDLPQNGDLNQLDFQIFQLFQLLYQAYHQGQQILDIPYHSAMLSWVEMLYRSQYITAVDRQQMEEKQYLRLTLNLEINREDLRSQILKSFKTHLSANSLPLSPDLQIFLEQLKETDPQRRIEAIEALGDYVCGA